MMLVLAIFFLLLCPVLTFTMIVMLLASGANSTPKQLREIKLMLWCVGLCGVAGFVGGIIAATQSSFGLSIGLSLFPVVVSISLFTWMWVTEY